MSIGKLSLQMKLNEKTGNHPAINTIRKILKVLENAQLIIRVSFQAKKPRVITLTKLKRYQK